MSTGGTWIGRDLPQITRDGKSYFLLSHKDVLYLVLNICPHRGGPLKFGYVDEACRVVCPMHGNAYPVERLISAPSTLRLSAERVTA